MYCPPCDSVPPQHPPPPLIAQANEAQLKSTSKLLWVGGMVQEGVHFKEQ